MPVGTHYGDTSIKEDVAQVIFQITPEDTPFYNMIGDSTANSPKHEWQIRSLTTRADNAQIEGNTYTFTAPVLPTRVSNLTQIFGKFPRVSNTSQATSRHAIGDLMADQIAQKMVEWKTDVEHALLRGSTASGNASDTARRMNGLIAALSTNATSFASGVSLSETHLNDLLQNIWSSGGKPRDVLVNGYLKRRISGFTGGSTKNFEQTEKTIINTVSVYESDFSVVAVHLSRDVPGSAGAVTNALLAVDRDMFAKAWLRSPVTKRVAEVADSVDAVVIGELTLEFGNEAAGGAIKAAL